METERTMNDTGSFKEVSTLQQNSIEISCDAKGEYSFKVKVYEDDPQIREAKLSIILAQARKAVGL